MNHQETLLFNSKITNFEDLCLELFQFQFQRNSVYQNYCKHVGIENLTQIKEASKIPYLPIQFFKTFEVKSFEEPSQKTFYSSSTGGNGQSKHLVKSLKIYEESFVRGFEIFFGPIEKHCILGLLPSYLEREGSSLIYMVQHLMHLSKHPLNGFFLYEHQTLQDRILHLERLGQTYYIFGVSFALLDFVQKFPTPIVHGKIIETGGMKGRKKEITKIELYTELEEAFKTKNIFSEYGMTELLSQAYSKIDGRYQCPPWMHVSVVDPNDPFTELPSGKTGLIRVIDLANKYSCGFILTSDLGKSYGDGTFEVLGRLDNSDLRGCSLMV
ncbi:MAG: acyl transferase [Bacteroidia bacterium]|nr:acyl transferase [Bacteroidia bacterium]